MTSEYNILFSMAVTHTYYQSGYCKHIVYKASEDTKKIMNAYSFVLMYADTGFSFYTEKTPSLEKLLKYIENVTGMTSFNFEASVTDPAFYQFTQFPVNKIGIINYESNRSSEAGRKLILKGVFKERTDTLCLFTLKIRFADLIAYINDRSSVTFYAEFQARSTQWQYNIINNSGQHFDELFIRSHSEIIFNKPENIVMENGQKAFSFSSGAYRIPLKEVPEYQFDLVSTTMKLGKSRSKTLFKGLPYPAPDVMKITNEAHQEEVTSLMYVYI